MGTLHILSFPYFLIFPLLFFIIPYYSLLQYGQGALFSYVLCLNALYSLATILSHSSHMETEHRAGLYLKVGKNVMRVEAFFKIFL